MSEVTPEEFKTKWVSALRSGEYTKTEGTFYAETPNCFCTLGLAIHLISEDGCTRLNQGMLQLEALWPSLRDVDDGNLYNQIVNRNDGENGFEPHTFEQMADFLEERL